MTFNHEKIEFSNPNFGIFTAQKVPDGNVKNFHEQLEIKYYYDGNSAMMIDNQVFALKKGNIVIVNPYEIHTNVNLGDNDAKYFLVILNLDFLSNVNYFGFDLRSIFLSNREKLVNFIESDSEISYLIERVCNEVKEKQENYQFMVYGLISQLLTMLLRKYKSTQKAVLGGNFLDKNIDIIAPALSKIFSDYKNPISVDELASLCGISKYHFCRVFKREMKVTAIEYINNYRLSLAEIMLKNKTYTTEVVARACGFNDVSYFYRCYKKLRNKPFKRN